MKYKNLILTLEIKKIFFLMANKFFGVRGAFFLGSSGDAKQIFYKVSLTDPKKY